MRQKVLKALIVLAVPTIIEQILSTLMQYVDTAMVGKLGEEATAAVSVTTTITWLTNSLASAIGIAVLAMISKAVGEKNERDIKSISKQALFLVTVCGVVMGAVCIVLSPFIPEWMGADEAIRKNASLYFLIISIPMVFREANTILGAALRATKDTKQPMLINMSANIVNVLFNIVFIYLLQMGVTGAAIATAVSYTFSGSLMYVAYRRNQQLYWEYHTFEIDKAKLRECAVIGMPVLGTNFTSCLGYVVFAALVSGMGTTIFAAHSIAVTAETIFYIPGYGLRTATSTLVGISLGEKDRGKFETVRHLSVVITIIMMCMTGLLLYLVAYPLMQVLTNSHNVAVLGAEMLQLVAFTEPFFGLMIVMEGILYGLGRTKYAFIVETFCMWGIRIIFTALCVKVWNLGLRAVWYCMIADNICKALLLTVPMMSGSGRKKLFPYGQ